MLGLTRGAEYSEISKLQKCMESDFDEFGGRSKTECGKLLEREISKLFSLSRGFHICLDDGSSRPPLNAGVLSDLVLSSSIFLCVLSVSNDPELSRRGVGG